MTFNKYAGASLVAIVVVIVIGLIVGERNGGEGEGEAPEMAQAPAPAPAPGPAAPAAPGPAAPPAAAAGASLGARLAAADAAEGELFTIINCQACHSFNPGVGAFGPNLWGVVGRPKAAIEGFDYSEALAAAGGNWTLEDLDSFLAGPRAYLPGTVMTYPGGSDAGARADLLLYMRSRSDDPVPLPGP